MKIGSYYTHPAADCLELIDGDEFKKLCKDIKANGLRDPIVLFHDGSEVLLLDGRNRLRACLKTGVKPRFVDLDDVDPIDYVESKNLSRRHLTAGQRALAANKLAKLRAGQKKPEAPATTKGGKAAAKPITQREAAQKRHVSERYVRDARVVDEHAVPEVQRAAGRGELALDAAAALARLPKAEQRAIAKKEFGKGKEIKSGHVRAIVHQAKKREIAAKIEAERTPLPMGPYRVIVSDPPWLYENSDNHAGSRGHTKYPPMTVDQICALGPEVQATAHPEGCVLWLWTTNAHLVDGSAPRVVREWGFKPITMLTWRKSNLGMGSWLRNRTEHAILAVRGPAMMVNTTQSTWLESITTSTDFNEVMRRVGNIHTAAVDHGRELEERLAHLADLHDQVERGATPATRLREMIGELGPLVAKTTSEIKNACDDLMHHPPADSLEAKVNGHSVKPPEFFVMVERTCPGSKLYMFPGEEKREGWARWGEPNDTARATPANRLLAAGSDEVKPANLPVSEPEPEAEAEPAIATPAANGKAGKNGHKAGTFEERLEAKTEDLARQHRELDAMTEESLTTESGMRHSVSNIAWTRRPECWVAEVWGASAKPSRNRAAANLRAGGFIVETTDEDTAARFRSSYFIEVRGREAAPAIAEESSAQPTEIEDDDEELDDDLRGITLDELRDALKVDATFADDKWKLHSNRWEIQVGLGCAVPESVQHRAAALLESAGFVVSQFVAGTKTRKDYLVAVYRRRDGWTGKSAHERSTSAAMGDQPMNARSAIAEGAAAVSKPSGRPVDRPTLEQLRELAPDTLLSIEWPGTADGKNSKMAQFVSVTRTGQVNVRVERVTATGRPNGKYGSVRAIAPETVIAHGPFSWRVETPAGNGASKPARSWSDLLQPPHFSDPDSVRELHQRARVATVTPAELRELTPGVKWKYVVSGSQPPIYRAVFRDKKLYDAVWPQIAGHGFSTASQYKGPKGYIEICGRITPPPARSKATKFADLDAGLEVLNAGVIARAHVHARPTEARAQT